MDILKSIKVNQFKIVPAIGFGYWKNNYTGEYGQLGYTHCIQILFLIYRWGVVNIIKQEQTLLEKIKEISYDLKLEAKKPYNEKVNYKVQLPESYLYRFNNDIKEEWLNSGLVIIASSNMTGSFNSYSTMEGNTTINHEPSNRIFSIELIEKND